MHRGERRADLNSLSFLEALLAQKGELRSIPKHLLPWGGPTLSALWPPGDPRASELPADLDSTAWHFKLNRMPIPSSVTNRFLSEAPLPEPFASACRPPECSAARIPRFSVGSEEIDFLAAINFSTGLDENDALNARVLEAVRSMRAIIKAEAIEWSVSPAAALEHLMAIYDERKASGSVPEFVYRRSLPGGERIEVRNSRIAELLTKAP